MRKSPTGRVKTSGKKFAYKLSSTRMIIRLDN
jgi:hypothetical protein